MSELVQCRQYNGRFKVYSKDGMKLLASGKSEGDDGFADVLSLTKSLHSGRKIPEAHIAHLKEVKYH